jgi:hypothetical protein
MAKVLLRAGEEGEEGLAGRGADVFCCLVASHLLPVGFGRFLGHVDVCVDDTRCSDKSAEQLLSTCRLNPKRVISKYQSRAKQRQDQCRDKQIKVKSNRMKVSCVNLNNYAFEDVGAEQKAAVQSSKIEIRKFKVARRRKREREREREREI